MRRIRSSEGSATVSPTVGTKFQSSVFTRSEGPSINSPVREGGEPLLSIHLRPEGPAQLVAHLRRSGLPVAATPPSGLLSAGP